MEQSSQTTLVRDRGLYKRVLARDGYTCQNCGEAADHAHHVVPISLGGRDLASNMISLCSDCHGKVHNRDLTRHAALTKAGMEAAKKRGVKFGGVRPGIEARNAATRAAADRRIAPLEPYLRRMVAQECSYRQMSARLANLGMVSQSGTPYSPAQARRMCIRLGLIGTELPAQAETVGQLRGVCQQLEQLVLGSGAAA